MLRICQRSTSHAGAAFLLRHVADQRLWLQSVQADHHLATGSDGGHSNHRSAMHCSCLCLIGVQLWLTSCGCYSGSWMPDGLYKSAHVERGQRLSPVPVARVARQRCFPCRSAAHAGGRIQSATHSLGGPNPDTDLICSQNQHICTHSCDS